MKHYAGIDVGKGKHWLAIVDEDDKVVFKSKGFPETREGFEAMNEVLEQHSIALLALEATGHYWKNLFVELVAVAGLQVALVNPRRTAAFAKEEQTRVKTDAADALAIARFCRQKRPEATGLGDLALETLRELVRLRDRLVQDRSDRLRQLHRAMDLAFPEFPKLVTLDSQLAWTLLQKWPTALAFQKAKRARISATVYDGRHHVGRERAEAIQRAAKRTVGAHQGEVWVMQIRMYAEDLELFTKRIRQLDQDIETFLDGHDVGKRITTIPGLGPNSAARILAAADPTQFRSAKAFTAYFGVTPYTRKSGSSKTSDRAAISRIGNAELRRKLWMPTLTAIQKNPAIKPFYERLRERGKPPKVALVASMRKLLTVVYAVANQGHGFVVRSETG